ncbi:Non-catalytic module family DOC2, partial [Piromyces sp. E2]
MKNITLLSLVASVFTGKALADCFATRLGYPCCVNTNKVEYVDSDGEWGVENNNWCGIEKKSCWANRLGYSCCSSTTDVVYVDDDGKWGVENNNWCGI